MRERVHFIGFVDEEDYVAGEIPRVPHFIGNPNLFGDEDEAMAAFAAWPLQRS